MRLRRAAATATAVALAALAGAAPAVAAPGSPTGADFAVGSSSDILDPDAHGVIHSFLTLANSGTRSLRISLRTVGVKPLDDGRVQLLDQPDPVWGAASSFTPEVTLAPQGYRRLPLTITVPSGVQPDLYLLGYLADAVPVGASSAAAVVRSRISTLVTVRLPGSRQRRVRIDSSDNGFLRIGDDLSGTFAIHNTGVAATLIRGQVRIDTVLGKDNVGVVEPQNRRLLLAAGTSRTVGYHWSTGRLFTLVRPTVEVAYSNDTAAPLTVVQVGRPVLLLPWRTIVLAAVLLAALTGAAVLAWRRRRRRRAAATPDGAGRHGRHRAPAFPRGA